MLSPEQAQRLLELQAKIDNGESLADDEQKEYDALKVLSRSSTPPPPTPTPSPPRPPTPAASTSTSTTGCGPRAGKLPRPRGHRLRGSRPSRRRPRPADQLDHRHPPRRRAPQDGLRGHRRAQGRHPRQRRQRRRDHRGAVRRDPHRPHREHRAVAWSGELWSGLQYEPVWSDLLSHGDLTYWEGKGWRFVTTPEMQDYAGDKAAIPSGTVTTEDSSYEAARMAVGVDVDRKFYDFPNEAFVNGLFEKIRESWEIKLDAKVKAFVLAQAVAGTRTDRDLPHQRRRDRHRRQRHLPPPTSAPASPAPASRAAPRSSRSPTAAASR
jgi:hypothetical protein